MEITKNLNLSKIYETANTRTKLDLITALDNFAKSHPNTIDPETFAEEKRKLFKEVSKEESFTTRVTATLKVNMDAEIETTGKAIAAEFFMSEQTLRRRLKDEGTNFNKIRKIVKNEKAINLMTTNRTLADIAIQVGYTEPSSFQRAFKSINGVTPGDYRAGSR